MPHLVFRRRFLNFIVIAIHVFFGLLFGAFVYHIDLLDIVRISNMQSTRTLYGLLNLDWLVNARSIGYGACSTLCFLFGSKVILYGRTRANEVARFFISSIGIQIILAGLLHFSLLGVLLFGGWWNIVSLFVLVFEASSLSVIILIMYLYWDYIIAGGLRIDHNLDTVQKSVGR